MSSFIPQPTQHILDPTRRSPHSHEFESQLRSWVIGQGHVIDDVIDVIQTYVAGLHDPDRPVGTFLLLGPTGVGKTLLAESVDRGLHRRAKADLIKINCAEFQEEHSVANLTGAPVGYVNHSDKRWITNEDLQAKCTPEVPLVVVLLDEIEKAHHSIFRLLLNVFDKGTMTLSNQEVVDFRNTLIFMTSNLGVKELEGLVRKGIGFDEKPKKTTHAEHEKRAVAAAQKHFAAEFMNRIDSVLTFRHLSSEDLSQILEIELRQVQRTLTIARNSTRLILHVSEAAKKQLLLEGTSDKYNARHLRRAVRKRINKPLANFIGSDQVNFADLVKVDYQDSKFVYARICANEVGFLSDPEWAAYKQALL